MKSILDLMSVHAERSRDIMKSSLFSLLLMCCLAALPAHGAEVVAPDVLVKYVTEEMLAMLRADAGIQGGETRKAAKLIETRVLPHFDFPTMTRLAMGKNWLQATPEQRTALTKEFRTLLIRIYASSLWRYRDQTIEYRPLKLAPGASDVVVKSTIWEADGEPIAVDYRMERSESGWKVYDVKFGGMSLVENYRSAFSAEIQRLGIDGLINELAEQNRAFAG